MAFEKTDVSKHVVPFKTEKMIFHTLNSQCWRFKKEYTSFLKEEVHKIASKIYFLIRPVLTYQVHCEENHYSHQKKDFYTRLFYIFSLHVTLQS